MFGTFFKYYSFYIVYNIKTNKMVNIYEYVYEVIKTNQFAQGGVVISVIMSMFSLLKTYPLKIWNYIERLIFYQVNIEETDKLYLYFELWLSKHYNKTYRNVEAGVKFDKNVDDWNNTNIITGDVIKPKDEEIHFKQFNDIFYIRRKFNLIKISKNREKLENANSLKNAYYNKFILRGLSKKVINELIFEVHNFCLEQRRIASERVISVKVSTQYGDWVDENVIEPKDLSKIFLDNKYELLEDINKFTNNKKWYTDRCILYKRGYMFSGDAGCGKTTLALSIAKELKKSINFLQVNSLNDDSLRNAFKSLQSDSILIIEDIDAVFVNRDGNKVIKFSFSTLLNCLDGVFSKENIIVIFTTNHPELLDTALIRAGRIDYIMEFKKPSLTMVIDYLNMFYIDHKIDFNSILINGYNESLPMSVIQDYCLRNSDNPLKAFDEIIELDKK